MDILMGLVIAMFIITAAYVGYHASQEPADVGGHDINMEFEAFSVDLESVKNSQIILQTKSS